MNPGQSLGSVAKRASPGRTIAGCVAWTIWLWVLSAVLHGQVVRDTSVVGYSLLNFGTGQKQLHTCDRRPIVMIGDSTSDDFDPSFTMTLWDGECRFKVQLSSPVKPISSTAPSVSRLDDTAGVLISTPTLSHRLFARQDNRLEWETILPARPDTNRFTYAIQSERLRFSFQRELTQAQLEKGHLRPDSVVGSYAVYRSDGKRHDRTFVDGGVTRHEIYGTGKAFHIFRPKAWDASGDTIWCDLHIDADAGMLSLIVPQPFLDRAAYPVVIDPTFGYTAMGASKYVFGSGATFAAKVVTTSEAGTVDSVIAGMHDNYNDRNMSTGFYSDNNGPDTVQDKTYHGSSTGGTCLPCWVRLAMSGEATISAGTTYWLAARETAIMYDDDAGSDEVQFDGASDFPDNGTWSNDAGQDSIHPSVYLHYTVFGGSDDTSRRRHLIIGEY